MPACNPKREVTFHTALKINDKDIELNDFLQILFAEILFGMVKPLKDVGEPDTISLTVSKKT